MHISIASEAELKRRRSRGSVRKTHWTLAMEASDVGPASGALWISVTLQCRASKRPTGSCWMQGEHRFSIRCFVLSAE
jgi:hypothetical protein